MKKIIGLIAVSAAVASVSLAEEGNKGRDFRGRGMPIEEMDTDKNGSVSVQEFTDFHLRKAKERFDRMDANKDGQLTAEELKQAHEKMRERGGGGEGRERQNEGSMPPPPEE